MTSVTLTGLTKRFGETPVVEGLDLLIPSASLFSLLGPSGCGKTTTLRMIAGLEEPTAGTVQIGERDVTRLPAHRRQIGMVFQNYALFPHLNVTANVAYGLTARKVPKQERLARAEAALARVDLAGYGTRRVGELSGGQQQRVAVARAIVLEPQVLLLDEPLSNLDPALRAAMRQELRELQQRLQITTVYVTHDREEALSMSDGIAVIESGRLQQVGTPTELYHHPASEFVARFSGPVNLVPVEVLEVADGTATVRLPTGESIRVEASDAELGRSRVLCVRPEAVRLTEGSAGVVQAVAFTGPTIEYEVRCGEFTWHVTEPNLRQALRSVGSEVGLSVVAEATALVP